ncbi:MAG: NAD-dependent epimerase/dehydratase family protein [Weeksellaceae bacterium]
MNILITGGVGFIGTNCALHFLEKGHKLTLVDNFSRPGVDENAKEIMKRFPAVSILECDIQDTDKYLEALKQAEVIIHLAGQTAVTTSIKDPQLDFNSNMLGGFTVLEAVRQHNPHAILLYSSTNKVYGDLGHHKLKKNILDKTYENITTPNGVNEDERIDLISPYGCSKGALDLYMQDYARIYGLHTVVFRQSCIYGPFQIGVEDQGWVAHFVKQVLFGNSLNIFGDGMQVRDLLHVQDLIQAYEKAIENIETVRGQALNVGGGIRNSYSLIQVLDIIREITGKTVDISTHETRQGDQNWFVSGNKKAKELLNWKPETDFKEGIKDLINWQKEFYEIV